MNLYHDISIYNDKDAGIINAVLEIPKGSSVKYEFDHKTGAMWLDRVGKTPINYTCNYGDLPQTWNEGDSDPLDILILSSQPLTTGTIIPCRVVGGLKMIDSGEDDYKILAVVNDKYYDNVTDINDVNTNELEDMEYYFKHYKDLYNKVVDLNGWDGKDIALARVTECHEAYKAKFSK